MPENLPILPDNSILPWIPLLTLFLWVLGVPCYRLLKNRVFCRKRAKHTKTQDVREPKSYLTTSEDVEAALKLLMSSRSPLIIRTAKAPFSGSPLGYRPVYYLMFDGAEYEITPAQFLRVLAHNDMVRRDKDGRVLHQ